jgi:hypothetical protein
MVGKSKNRRGASGVLKISCAPLIFLIKKCKQTDSSKIDRNCHIFANSLVGNALKGYWAANEHCKSV